MFRTTLLTVLAVSAIACPSSSPDDGGLYSVIGADDHSAPNYHCRDLPWPDSELPLEEIASTTDEHVSWGPTTQDSEHVYWVSQRTFALWIEVPTRLMSYGIETGALGTLAELEGQVFATATDASSDIYVLTDAGLSRVSKMSGEVTDLHHGSFGAMALGADAVFLLDEGGLFDCNGTGRIEVVSRATGAATTLVDGVDCPRAIAIDDTHVYFTALGERVRVGEGSSLHANAALQRIPRTGGAVETIVRAALSGGPLAVDDTHAYLFLDESTAGSPFSFARVAKSGGDLSVSVLCAIPANILLDGDRVIVNSLGSYASMTKDGSEGVMFGIGASGDAVIVGREIYESSFFSGRLVRRAIPDDAY